MKESKLILFWKILAVGLFISAICCLHYDLWKLGSILSLSYNYVMFEVLTTYVESQNDNRQ